MGVRFLQTYLEKTSKTACYEVSLPHIIQTYKSEKGVDPVIVLDGLSCTRPLCRGISWVTGCQFKQALDRFNNFIRSLLDLGCKLVVFFDGMIQEKKLPIWIQRKLTGGEKLCAIFSDLASGKSVEYIEKMYENESFIPNCLEIVFTYALSLHRNCAVRNSIRECDEEIAEYAYRNNVLAILGQDTDFVIYRAAPYYLSMKNLNFDKLTTLCYDGHRLVKELNLGRDQLPLLASLMGNDIVPYDSLKSFHYNLRRRHGIKDLVQLVSGYIRGLGRVNLSQVAQTAFYRQPNQLPLLEESIASYDLNITHQVNVKKTEDENWNSILELAIQKHVENYYHAPVYEVMFLCRHYTVTAFEDYTPANIIIPIGNLVKVLRQAIYGVILAEMPDHDKCFVNELMMTGHGSMDRCDPVKPKYLKSVEHPGLIALWTSEEDRIQEVRWKILGEIFSIQPDSMKKLPAKFVVPVLSTAYLKSQYSQLEDWEMNALISCNVCVSTYSPEELNALPAEPLTCKQIWIYSAITKIYYVVGHLLFLIGEPIPFENVVVHQFTDGKLFHYKYRQAKNQCSIIDLCNNKEGNLELFNLMKSVVRGLY